ncbi:hypothetical protein AMV109 [Betaentomopoxvirus amoorei]|uniref:AMV109 n=1 Tax=Amsacta moorei entomopoxvirus TaxID=28321 RepID=Q9EMU0_AMEPV|nr:hypothetical protein AMV109 [Amsacta moorei entomopoxvirus]AAG02815.1 AMV109 [Amsacta moorei entomopoxvirus]
MYIHFILILYNIKYILCYNYLSLIDEKSINDQELCISDYKIILNKKKCIHDYNDNKIECRLFYKEIKKYKTINNEDCISNCGNFENTAYQWCVTKSFNWDYCNKNISKTGILSYRTYNKYIACSDKCDNRGDKYYWCNTIGNNWAYCYPNKKIIIFNYRNEKNNVCASPCEIYSKNVAYCYDKNKNWEKCYLNPEYKNTLNDYNNKFISQCKIGKYTSDGYKQCKKNLSFMSCPLNVESVAKHYEDNNPSIIIRNIDPNNIITLSKNPIISYTVLPTYNYFGSIQINLPLIVRAIITNHTLRNPREIERFTSDINAYFNNMNPNLDNINYDKKGYLLGYKLGGPIENYNIFPQACSHNRGSMTVWQYMEIDLYNFLINNPNRYIEYTAIMNYRTDDGILNYRPTSAALRIRLYDNNILVDISGSPITFITNSLENIYYTNNPDHNCEIED